MFSSNGMVIYTIARITRGTRQGSILSPVLFNLFLSGLILELSLCERVVNHLYNSFAYADDVSLFSTTVPGLQKCIDIYTHYSSLWCFNFGIKKTKCLKVCRGYCCFMTTPQWYMYLKNKCIQNVEDMAILGVTFNNNNIKYYDYVSTRIQKAKQSMFSISNIGMSCPSLNTKS